MHKILQVLKNSFIFICLVFLLISCGPKVIYSHKEKIEGLWMYNQPVQFEYEVLDTTKAYDLFLTISHSSTFLNENVYVKATTLFPDGNKTSSPISLQLANQDGEWAGKCDTEECETAIVLSQAAYYKKPGKYGLIFEQFSRSDSLEGIRAFELKLLVSEN